MKYIIYDSYELIIYVMYNSNNNFDIKNSNINFNNININRVISNHAAGFIELHM